jgi:hypothetical protein
MMSVKMQEEEIHRRNMARLQNFKGMYNANTTLPELSPSVYTGHASMYEPVIGEERGRYHHGVFFPDN